MLMLMRVAVSMATDNVMTGEGCCSYKITKKMRVLNEAEEGDTS